MSLDFVTEKKITELVHDRLAGVIRERDRVIDATAGNGFDTLFLAQRVGPEGAVVALDIQPEAIAEAGGRLQRHEVAERVQLLQADHACLLEVVPPGWLGRVRAIVFNLGYLPGADKAVVTRPDSTISALDHALDILMPGGVLSIAIYHTHPGGVEELESIRHWASSLEESSFSIEWIEKENPRAPKLLWVQKTTTDPPSSKTTA